MSKLKKIKQTNKKHKGKEGQTFTMGLSMVHMGPALLPRLPGTPHTLRQVLVSVCHGPCYLCRLPPRPSLLAAHSIHSSHSCLLLVLRICRVSSHPRAFALAVLLPTCHVVPSLTSVLSLLACHLLGKAFPHLPTSAHSVFLS